VITLILFFAAISATAYTLGRVHERQMASIRRAQNAENERVMRPWVTVTDGGPLDDVAIAVTREVLREEEPKGRHHIGVAIGTRTQRAGWNTPTHQFHALIGATWSAQERADLEEAVA
jgi:hypothetical protein